MSFTGLKRIPGGAPNIGFAGKLRNSDFRSCPPRTVDVPWERWTAFCGRRAKKKLASRMKILACCCTQHAASRTVVTVVLQCPKLSVVPV